MGRAGKIARRTFLIGSAAVTGGALFGVYAWHKPVDNPLAGTLPEGAAALTPYVRVDGQGVTLIAPRAELGQGAQSLLAALLAEEMDLPWEDIRIEHGPPSEAYYNGEVIAEGIPVTTYRGGLAAAGARGASAFLGKVMGVQVTGGSTTAADAYERLRASGAAAREALKEAAAARSGQPLGALRTGDGAVILPDGERLSYASLASDAATITPRQDVPLRDPSEWRILGQPRQRQSSRARVTGAPLYGIDMRREGMVFATVRTNPAMGGGVRGYDASAAEAMRGVIKVVPVTGGAGVIADNTWRAFRAAGAIQFDFGAAPYPGDTPEQWAQVAAAFTEDHRDSRFRDDGDAAAALAAGADVEAEYRVPCLAHAPLEPMTAVAELGEGRIDIWTATQIPLFARARVAQMTGLEEAQVHIHVLPAGGSFGRRLEDDFIRQVTELALAYPGAPVKMTLSREEDMTHDFPRPLQMARGRGAVSGGRVTALDLSIAAPSVSASQTARLDQSVPGPDVAITAGAWDQPFAIPDCRVTGYRVPAMMPVSSWRSVGASANAFFHDCLLDELIHAAGADPVEERLRLCDHAPSRRVIETVAEMAGWGAALPEGVGRGIGFCLSFGVPAAEIVEVEQTGAGIRLRRAWGVAEVGRVLDPLNLENQMQGGMIWGLGHAMHAQLTYRGGVPEQRNFDGFRAMRMYECPPIEVRALETTGEVRGIGEPMVPPAAPALANAIFAATGARIRSLPLAESLSFA